MAKHLHPWKVQSCSCARDRRCRWPRTRRGYYQGIGKSPERYACNSTGHDLPERDTQSPDRLHLVAYHLTGSDPVAEHHFAPSLTLHHAVQLALELRTQLGRALGSRVAADHLAVQIAEGFADHAGNDDESDEDEQVEDGVEEVR